MDSRAPATPSRRVSDAAFGLARRVSASLRRPVAEKTIADGMTQLAGSRSTSISAFSPAFGKPSMQSPSSRSSKMGVGLPPLRGIAEESSMPSSVNNSRAPSMSVSGSRVASISGSNNEFGTQSSPKQVYIPHSRDPKETAQVDQSPARSKASRPPMAAQTGSRESSNGSDNLTKTISALSLESDFSEVGADLSAAKPRHKRFGFQEPSVHRSDSTLAFDPMASSASLATPSLFSHQASSLSVSSISSFEAPPRTNLEMEPPTGVRRSRPVVPASPSAQRLPRSPYVSERTLVPQASEISLASSMNSISASPRLSASPRMPHAASTQSLASLASHTTERYGPGNAYLLKAVPKKDKWRDHVPESVIRGLDESEIQRQEKMWEFWHSETKDSKDMKCLIERHCKRLAQAGELPKDLAHLIFALAHLEAIHQEHSFISDEIRRRLMDNHMVVDSMADVIVEALRTVVPHYAAYNATISERIEKFNLLRTLDKAMADRIREKDNISGAFNIDEAIRLPCFVMSKWHTMCESLAKYTPVGHPDHEACKHAAYSVRQAMGYIEAKSNQLMLRRSWDLVQKKLRTHALLHADLIEVGSDTDRVNLQNNLRENWRVTLEPILEPVNVVIMPKDAHEPSGRQKRVFSGMMKRRKEPEQAVMCFFAGGFALVQGSNLALLGMVKYAEIKPGYELPRGGGTVLIDGESVAGWAPDFRTAIRPEGISAERLLDMLKATTNSYPEAADLKKMEKEGGWGDVEADKIGWIDEVQPALVQQEERGLRRSFSTALLGGGRH